jgi:hypothetical protein
LIVHIPKGSHYENPCQRPGWTVNADSDSHGDWPILLKCLGWEKTLWSSQIHAQTRPKIVKTKIADPRSATLAKNALWKERLVLIDGALSCCDKSFSKKNPKER